MSAKERRRKLTAEHRHTFLLSLCAERTDSLACAVAALAMLTVPWRDVWRYY